MTKKAHILGVCGVFMGSLAILLKQAGWTITGSDKAAYPPMSDLLQEHGVDVLPEDISLIHPKNGLMVIGNALSRGNPMVEAILDQRIPYTSGPALLSREVLAHKHVIAISGTHGKTTTTSLLAWVLQYAGYNPGFLIGGRPANFAESARIGEGNIFVIEADEYDTAFFDKRSKFLHYQPTDLLINNIEFDHADIFPDLQAIQTQFHHLLRIVPSNGTVLCNDSDSIRNVIERGCWSRQIRIGERWKIQFSGDAPEVLYNNQSVGKMNWSMTGEHNAINALACLILAHNVGVDIPVILEALGTFQGIARRQQLLHKGAITVYDDFAHHPTAIAATLTGFRHNLGAGRIVVLLHVSSNSMRSGAHAKYIPQALADADSVLVYQTQGDSIDEIMHQSCQQYEKTVSNSTDVISALQHILLPGDTLVLMSNGDLKGIREEVVTLAESIATKYK